ncbi:MAG: hypothetical protein FVQ84_05235 [Planctomycetes bacterium]|nr:hypothetical protein [Planctomycetota bacterium]
MALKMCTNKSLFLLILCVIFSMVACDMAYAQEQDTWLNRLLGFTEPAISDKPYARIHSQGIQKQQSSRGFGSPLWWGISANLESAYRNTNFDNSGHHTVLSQGDSRLEFWMPPGRDEFSWGPYVRFAGLTSDRSPAWENTWLAQPGYGINVYPFSAADFRKENQKSAYILGPLRLFGEYSRQDYWGSENIWRPNEQVRVGADYWRQRNVNNLSKPTWSEIWTGLIWQSANEFDKDYNTLTFGNALRLGFRKPDTGILSMITPYLVMESSFSENRRYYWDNRLLLGGGIRFAPPLKFLPREWQANRFVIFAEYFGAAVYYRDSAPSSVPDYDFRIGISISIGEWFR